MEDDDEVKLSPFALEALGSFYNERDAREKQFEDLKVQAEDEFDQKQLSMDAFAEDWNASQFWVRWMVCLENDNLQLSRPTVQRRHSDYPGKAIT
jgi:hypothetical protein